MWQKLLQLQKSLQFVVSPWVKIFLFGFVCSPSHSSVWFCWAGACYCLRISWTFWFWNKKVNIPPISSFPPAIFIGKQGFFPCPCCFPCARFFTSVQQTKVLQEQEGGGNEEVCISYSSYFSLTRTSGLQPWLDMASYPLLSKGSASDTLFLNAGYLSS